MTETSLGDYLKKQLKHSHILLCWTSDKNSSLAPNPRQLWEQKLHQEIAKTHLGFDRTFRLYSVCVDDGAIDEELDVPWSYRQDVQYGNPCAIFVDRQNVVSATAKLPEVGSVVERAYSRYWARP